MKSSDPVGFSFPFPSLLHCLRKKDPAGSFGLRMEPGAVVWLPASTCRASSSVHSLPVSLYRLTAFSSTTSKPTTPPAAPRWWAGSGPTWYPKSWGWLCLPPCSLPNQTMQHGSSSRSSRARRAKSWQQQRGTRAARWPRTDTTSWNTCLPLSQETLLRAGMQQGATWRIRLLRQSG